MVKRCFQSETWLVSSSIRRRRPWPGQKKRQNAALSDVWNAVAAAQQKWTSQCEIWSGNLISRSDKRVNSCKLRQPSWMGSWFCRPLHFVFICDDSQQKNRPRWRPSPTNILLLCAYSAPATTNRYCFAASRLLVRPDSTYHPRCRPIHLRPYHRQPIKLRTQHNRLAMNCTRSIAARIKTLTKRVELETCNVEFSLKFRIVLLVTTLACASSDKIQMRNEVKIEYFEASFQVQAVREVNEEHR